MKTATTARVLSAAVLLVLAAACAARPSLQTTFQGVALDLRGDSISLTQQEGQLLARLPAGTLRLSEGFLAWNDVDLGAVAPGDRVMVTDDGRVLVNDAVRAPAAAR